MDYKVFFISVILRAASNEIDSNINWRTCLMGRKVKKEGENKNTKWGNSEDIWIYDTTYIKNQLSEPGRDSAMYVATWIIYNLLLKARNMSEI